MRDLLQGFPTIVLLLIATTLEVSGDAIVRSALYNQQGSTQVAFFVLGACSLLGYGTFVNLSPLAFGEIVGLYIATLFIVWQAITFIAFRTLPTLPIVVGGTLVIAGGLIITFGKSA